MFEFFGPKKQEGKLNINLPYWAEKVEAQDRRVGGVQVFSPERFKQRVSEVAEQWIEDCNLEEEWAEELRYEVKYQVLSHADEGESESYRALWNFDHKIDGNKFQFIDFHEWNFKEYTFHYVWLCYAIAWGIRQYELARNI